MTRSCIPFAQSHCAQQVQASQPQMLDLVHAHSFTQSWSATQGGVLGQNRLAPSVDLDWREN